MMEFKKAIVPLSNKVVSCKYKSQIGNTDVMAETVGNGCTIFDIKEAVNNILIDLNKNHGYLCKDGCIRFNISNIKEALKIRFGSLMK